MASVAIYDPNSTPNKITQYLQSVNTPDYSSKPNVLINPDVSALQGVDIRYWKHVAGAIVQMTTAEKNAVDAAFTSGVTNVLRIDGKAIIDMQSPQGIILRALADILVDEINVVRGWLQTFKAQTAAATSLANLQTRVASLPDTPDRTLLQFKNAIKTAIDAGTVDN